MKQMFKCEGIDPFSLDDCIMVSVPRPGAAQEGEGYAKVYIADRQNISHNIVRKDYDRLVDEKEMFQCEDGNLLSLNACISISLLRPEVVQKLLEREGVTYYAQLYISDVSKTCMCNCNITREDYDRLSKVYIDPIFGNRI